MERTAGRERGSGSTEQMPTGLVEARDICDMAIWLASGKGVRPPFQSYDRGTHEGVSSRWFNGRNTGVVYIPRTTDNPSVGFLQINRHLATVFETELRNETTPTKIQRLEIIGAPLEGLAKSLREALRH